MFHDDYKIGWVCALPTELAAAASLLDEEHPTLPGRAQDDNIYIFGRLGQHNVVIACLPLGVMGVTSASRVAEQMRVSFPLLRFALLVGIGGGVPSTEHDIRLGDVVVSKPSERSSGVIQYDYGRTLDKGVTQLSGSLNRPPDVLLKALSTLQAQQMYKGSRIRDILALSVERRPDRVDACTRPDLDTDVLFPAEYSHTDPLEPHCHKCDPNRMIPRSQRMSSAVKIHHGLIASGNQVMRDGATRNRLGRELNVLCFEMEASGLMDSFPCLAIRGICDYADSHKNKAWQDYAAAVAAAYAAELLGVVPPQENALAHTSDASRPGRTMESRNDLRSETPVLNDAANKASSLHPSGELPFQLSDEQRFESLIRRLVTQEVGAILDRTIDPVPGSRAESDTDGSLNRRTGMYRLRTGKIAGKQNRVDVLEHLLQIERRNVEDLKQQL